MATNEIKNVEIFATGVWNGHEIFQEDLEQIARNTNDLIGRGTNKPMLRFGHSTNQIMKGQTDGDPALGYAQNIRVEGKKLIADFVNVPSLVLEAIGKKLYNAVSVGLQFSKDLGSFFLQHVALLGADAPAVKVLGDLESFLASDDQSDIADIESLSLSFSEPVIENQEPEKDDMENQELEQNFADAQKTIEEQKAIIAEYAQRENEIRFSAVKEEILAPYKEDVKEGVLAPAVLEKIEAHLEEAGKNFHEQEGVSLPSELVREICVAYKDVLPQGEQASAEEVEQEEVRADLKLEKEAREIMAKTGKTYSEASKLALENNPELATEIREFTQNFQTRHEMEA